MLLSSMGKVSDDVEAWMAGQMHKRNCFMFCLDYQARPNEDTQYVHT